MIAYIVLAISPVVFWMVLDRIKGLKAKQKRVILCVLFGLVLFVLMAFKNKGVGSTDSNNYYNNWLRLRGMSFARLQRYTQETTMEAGYLYSVWLLSKIFYHPQFVFVLSAILFSVSVCRFTYLNSENIVVSLVMFVCLGLYTFMVQGLRQAIAMAICLFAIEECKKRRPIRFLLLIALAFLYHRTSIIFAIIYLGAWEVFNGEAKAQICVTSSAALLLSPLLIRYGNELIGKDYEGFVESGGIIALAIYAIILLASALFINERGDRKRSGYNLLRKKEITNTNALFFYMTLLGMVFYMMRFFAVLAMERISFYFMFGQIILLPSVIKAFEPKARTGLNVLVVGLSIALFWYRMRSSDLVPYYFFWQ